MTTSSGNRVSEQDRHDAVRRAELAEAALELDRRTFAARLAEMQVALDQLQAAALKARSEVAAYHAAAESADLEGDVRDHLADLAEWETDDRGAPDWLVDSVIGLLAPLKAERDKSTTQVARVRELHSPDEDPRRVRDCRGCRTHVSFTYYEDCKTLRALDGTEASDA